MSKPPEYHEPINLAEYARKKHPGTEPRVWIVSLNAVDLLRSGLEGGSPRMLRDLFAPRTSRSSSRSRVPPPEHEPIA